MPKANRGWRFADASSGYVSPRKRVPTLRKLQCPVGECSVFLQVCPQTQLILAICFLFQRAKIGQGTKTPEEKTTNTISKFDNNGNRDRMKLTDFNFLMVLGKGSFGKVQYGVVTVSTREGTAPRAGTCESYETFT